MELLQNAIIVADVHYSKNYRREDFEELLLKLELSPPPQLILLGDIFDLLFGDVEYTVTENREVIERIDLLGEKCEVLYFEGNHDFNLSNLFKNVKIFPLSQQPIEMKFGDKKVLIAHGDYRGKSSFLIYRKLIEKRWLLKILNKLDILLKQKIIKEIEESQKRKRKCYKIKGFKDIIEKELVGTNSDYFIEGHYHQGYGFNIGNMGYFNLPSFACNQSCFIVKSKQKRLLYKNINLKDL
jgi:UDP-2,3-diacylglucosamine hydrolase